MRCTSRQTNFIGKGDTHGLGMWIILRLAVSWAGSQEVRVHSKYPIVIELWKTMQIYSEDGRLPVSEALFRNVECAYRRVRISHGTIEVCAWPVIASRLFRTLVYDTSRSSDVRAPPLGLILYMVQYATPYPTAEAGSWFSLASLGFSEFPDFINAQFLLFVCNLKTLD